MNLSGFEVQFYYSDEEDLTGRGVQTNIVEIPAGKINNTFVQAFPDVVFKEAELEIGFTLENILLSGYFIVVEIPE